MYAHNTHGLAAGSNSDRSNGHILAVLHDPNWESVQTIVDLNEPLEQGAIDHTLISIERLLV